MVFTKDELITSLQNEVRTLLHLASQIDPAKLDYRPTPKQRSLLELLQYMTIMGPIHLRATLAGAFDVDAWRNIWQTGEAAANLSLCAIPNSTPGRTSRSPGISSNAINTAVWSAVRW